MIAVGATHIPYPLLDRALNTGNLTYLRRHYRQIDWSLLSRIRLLELVAEKEPAAVESEAVAFIRQWSAEVPGTCVEDYDTILGAVRAVRHAPERAVGELTSLCSMRGIY